MWKMQERASHTGRDRLSHRPDAEGTKRRNDMLAMLYKTRREMTICNRCQEEKDEQDFYLRKNNTKGILQPCKECRRSLAIRRKNNPGELSDYDPRAKYSEKWMGGKYTSKKHWYLEQ